MKPATGGIISKTVFDSRMFRGNYGHISYMRIDPETKKWTGIIDHYYLTEEERDKILEVVEVT